MFGSGLNQSGMVKKPEGEADVSYRNSQLVDDTALIHSNVNEALMRDYNDRS